MENNHLENGTEKKPLPVNRGLYGKLKIKVKTVNTVILIGVAALIVCTAIALLNRGFVINFDTNGGSHIESYKAMYGEKVSVDSNPVREGFVFNGWYRDKGCTYKWDVETDTVSESMTLYADWVAAEP